MKRRQRWPREACCFCVTSKETFGPSKTIGHGAVVVGVGVSRGLIFCDAPWHRTRLPVIPDALGVGWCYFPEEIKPLTPTARAMLSIAKGKRGGK